MKRNKGPEMRNTSPTQYGFGNFYGTGVRNKVGTIKPEKEDKSSSKKSSKFNLA